MQVVVGKKLDDVFMVMEFMEHDLKGLMEERDSTNPLFAMSEVPPPPSPLPSPPSPPTFPLLPLHTPDLSPASVPPTPPIPSTPLTQAHLPARSVGSSNIAVWVDCEVCQFLCQVLLGSMSCTLPLSAAV